MKKINIVIIVVMLLVIGVVVFLPKTSGLENIENFQGDIVINTGSSCGCCDLYGKYFQSKGNENAEVFSMEDVEPIKDKYNIPTELRSCHTVSIGKYYIEGHVPLEAIEKLLEEEPDIAGLAMGGMNGMPSGSPGMPGTKEGDFVIYAVERDGSYGEFMRI